VDAGVREKHTTQFNAFLKAIVAEAQIRSERCGRKAVNGADRGGTVVLASARGILGKEGGAVKSKAKGRETSGLMIRWSRTETKVDARAEVAVPRAGGRG
jgi:hypothetical protein